MSINTATHRITKPGYEGLACADCAAAIGVYEEMSGEERSSMPCPPCVEAERDADAERCRAEQEEAALGADALSAGQSYP